MIPDINLLPVIDKRQKTSNVFYILLGVVALLILAFLLWQYFSMKASITALQSEETALIQQRDQLQVKQSELTVKEENTTLEEVVEFVDIVSYPVLPLINEIENLRPTNSYLRSYSFSADSVTITVDFETLNDISEYISRLENSEFFVDGQVSNVSSFELGVNASGEEVEETEEVENTEDDFDAIPRRTGNFTLTIDEKYLATGGGE